MELNTGMTQKERADVGGALAKLLADTYVLYLKTQNFHWNLTGGEFISLHKLSQEFYEEMAEANDEIAERIRALGFFVEGAMESFLKLTSVPEEHKVHPKLEFIESLIEGHEILIREARKIFALAEKANDPATADLATRRLLFHEKAAWLLRSHV